MRKGKIVAIMLAAALTMSACGSNADGGNTAAGNTGENATSQESSSLENGGENSEVGAENGNAQQENTADSQAQEGAGNQQENIGIPHAADIFYASSMKNIQWRDDQGQVTRNLDTDLVEGDIRYVYDDTVITAVYEYNQDTSESLYKMYAYQADSGKTAFIRDFTDNPYVDMYEGRLIFTVHDYDSNEYLEYVYDPVTFNPIETGDGRGTYDDLYGYNIYWNNKSPFYNGQCSLDRYLKEYGYLIVNNDKGYYLYDGTNTKKISVMESGDYVQYYNKNCVIVSGYDSDTYKYKLKCFDFSGNWTELTDSYVSTLGLWGDMFYWYEKTEEVTWPTVYSVHYINVATQETGELPMEERHAGVSGYEPGISDFAVYADGLYYVSDDGKEVFWVRLVNQGDGEYVKERVGDTLKTMDYVKYGSVERRSVIKTCPLCGNPSSLVYMEYFRLKEDYCAQAAKINEALLKEAMELIPVEGTVVDDSVDTEDEYLCEMHATDYGHEEDSTDVGAIALLGSKYMTIDTSGYWYGGGAHGYPYNGQKLIDLEAGEILKFADLYTGTEADLKRIVATANAEYWEQCQWGDGEYYYYDDADYDSVYSQTTELVSVEYLNVQFYEYGIEILFSPYEFGPYASGYLSFLIPYEDLGLQDLLK